MVITTEFLKIFSKILHPLVCGHLQARRHPPPPATASAVRTYKHDTASRDRLRCKYRKAARHFDNIVTYKLNVER